MAQINGSFSLISSSNVKPYIYYSITQDIAGNYSDVYVELHFQRVNTAYTGFNNTGSANAQSNINGSLSNTSITFDLRGGTTDQIVRSRTVRVFHNADGTKSCYIGFDGDTQISWGNFNFGQTVTLPTIPREANISSSSVDFQIGNAVTFGINNPGNLWLKALLYVNGSLINTYTLGQVAGATITPDATDRTNMYAQMPNSTSQSMFFRLQTFTSSGYSVQVGSNQDKAGTLSLDQVANKPTFTTYTVANVDKTIDNTDKYANVLVSSSTATLLGSSTKMIKNYSKIRATITSGNKMVPLNSATGSKYRFTAGGQQSEVAYSAGSTVTMDIDNADTIDNSVTAFDSRSLTTTVNNSLANIANYVPTILFDMDFQRDNGIDSETKLIISGTFWKEYFGGGVAGVQNTVTAHYRYKETTVAWAAQTWNSLTLVDDGSGNLSFNNYINGDLGASGFDENKSYNVEVRIYDKLTNYILEGTLSIGIPVLDWTQNGVAINSKYNDTEGGDLQIFGKNIYRMTIPIGGTILWNSITLPFGFLFQDGSALSRTTYSELFNAIAPLIGNFTVTIATPGVFTLNSHPFKVGDKIYMTTTGALPTGLTANTIYYVTNPTTNTFNLSTSLANAIAGTKIATTGSQSGTHSMRSCPHGLGNGSTTFNLPAGAGMIPVGVDNSQDEFKALGITGGAKTHTITTSEMPVHTHTQNSHNHTQNQHNHETYRTTPKSSGAGAAGGDNIDGYGGGQGTANTKATNIAATATNQDAGSGGAMSILNPYFTTYFIIRYA